MDCIKSKITLLNDYLNLGIFTKENFNQTLNEVLGENIYIENVNEVDDLFENYRFDIIENIVEQECMIRYKTFVKILINPIEIHLVKINNGLIDLSNFNSIFNSVAYIDNRITILSTSNTGIYFNTTNSYTTTH